MSALAYHLENTLHEHDENNLLRKRFLIENRNGANITLQGKPVVNFCSNDYLNIADHPKIKDAFIRGIHDYGSGSGASSLVSGYFKPHYLLEEAFSEFLNREKSILFNSGYHANLGVLPVFAKRNSVVIADKLCHASLIDGIVLSRAKHARYHHNDMAHAEKLLKQYSNNTLLVTESIFSMQGNIANIRKLADLATSFQSMLIVDDAHGIGVLGENGRGICEHFNLSQQDVPCLITPLGKSFASFGAIVSGSKAVIETLLQFARTYCYTTAMPPAISCATLETLNIINNETWRREKLKYLSDLFTKLAHERNLSLASFDQTPIKSILVGSNKIALEIQDALLKKGFFVSCIRPPTVPINTARIRISLNCNHSEENIIRLLDELHAYKKID